nr:hypothetical protein [uncultured Desulfobacter sp.]
MNTLKAQQRRGVMVAWIGAQKEHSRKQWQGNQKKSVRNIGEKHE